MLGKKVKGNSSFAGTKKADRHGIYKAKINNKLDKVILPQEYKEIIKLINKYSII